MHNKVREPLFHIVKRDTLPWYQAWGIRAVAIVLALLLCALITTLCTHLNPIKVFGTMFGGAFGSPRKIWILGQPGTAIPCQRALNQIGVRGEPPELKHLSRARKRHQPRFRK